MRFSSEDIMTATNDQKNGSPDIEAYQAMKILDRGDGQAAVKMCIDAIAEYGDNRNCYLVKARAHIEMEEYGFAEEALHNVLRLDPEHPAAWAMLGEVYFRLGNELKMEYCRNRLETIFPVLTDALGQEDFDSDDLADTVEARKSIVPLEDLDTTGQKPVVSDEGFREEADEDSEPIVAENQPEAETAQRTGGLKSELFETSTFADICLQQGKLEKALAIYRKLLENDPENNGHKEKVNFIIQRLEENES